MIVSCLLHSSDGELESLSYGRFKSMEWDLREPSHICQTHEWRVPHDYSEVLLALLAPFVSYVDMIVFNELGGLI